MFYLGYTICFLLLNARISSAKIVLQDSNEIKKLTSDLLEEGSFKPNEVEGKSFEVTFTIDKRDLHILSFEQKVSLIATRADQKINYKLLIRTFKWNGPVSSINLPSEVKQAK